MFAVGHLRDPKRDRAILGGSLVALSALAWLLMIVAMMLPSSVPLVVTFGAIVGRRPQPRRLIALLVAGYLVVWGAFGLAAWVLDRGIHAAVAALPWLAAQTSPNPASHGK